MEYVGVGLLLLGSLWVAGFGYAPVRAVGQARAAETWPVAAGSVVSCEVVEEESSDRDDTSSTWYNPVVTYSYSAGAGTLTGRRLRFGNYRSATRKRAEAALAPYRQGQPVSVRYTPAKPDECVLETTRPGPLYLVMALFGFLFIAFGLLWGSMAG